MDWHRRNLSIVGEDFKELRFSRHDKPVTILEAFMHEPPTDCALQSYHELQGESLRAWLHKDLPKINGKVPLTGLRVILSPRNTKHPSRILHYLPFSKETYESICSAFAVHHSFIRTIIRGKSDFSKAVFVHEASQRHMTGYHIRSDDMLPGDIVLSATIDDRTGFVSALIHGCDEADIVTLSQWLEVLTPDIFNPLLLPALVMELIKTKHAAKIEERSAKILELSGASRQYDMSPKFPLDNVENYNTLTKEAYQLHQDAGDLFIACAQTKAHVKRLLKLARQAENTYNGTPNLNDAPWLIQQLEDTLDTYDHLEKTCQQVTQDSNLLMGAIYNLIAQRQNQVNLGIAAESRSIAADSRRISAACKRDSSVMRAIAILTMVFLPGTFVASFFSLPLLNWQAGMDRKSDDSVMSPRFWIYWAVTLPLTIFVLVLWSIWAFLTRSRTPEDDDSKLA